MSLLASLDASTLALWLAWAASALGVAAGLVVRGATLLRRRGR